MVASAIIGSAVIGAGSSLIAGGQAAGGAKDAADTQKLMYQITRNDLDPFRGIGVNALTPLYDLATGSPTGGGPDYVAMAQQNLPGNMSQAELEQTPGYKWNLAQGLKAVQGSAAARGVAVSGASLKGAATYATGLADSTYQNQFKIRQQNFEDILALNTGQQGNLTNRFNRVNALATLGANAAAQTGTQGTALANQAGGYLAKAGLLEGTGTMNATNALTGSLNNYLGYRAYADRTSALQPTTGGYARPDVSGGTGTATWE